MKQVVISLAITAEEFQRLYQGAARDVVALDDQRRRIRFPANILVPFVTHSGVRGRFRINFGDDNRFHSIEQIG